MGQFERQLRRRQNKADVSVDGKLERVFRGAIRSTRAPVALSHVTSSAEALESILSSGEIWASRSTAVNGDENELRIGERTALRVVQALLADEQRPFARTALDEFIACYTSERISEKAKVFIACFTETLGPLHWQTYGNAGRGFGFTLKVHSHQRPRDPEVELTLLPVEYDELRVETQLRALILRAFDVAEAIRSASDSAKANQLRSLLLRLAAVTAIRTKHRKFADEREWRIVALPEDDAEHRIVPAPIEHVAVPLNPPGRPDLQEIRIGPNCPDPRAVLARLERFLVENHYSKSSAVRIG
jgi:hypothetical protein